MSTMTLAAKNDWLDAERPTVDTTVLNSSTNGYTVENVTTTIGDWTGGTQWWTNTYYYPVYTSPARPIKLTLSEVERLRKAAKADEKLRAILKKFTQQIEITVDFGED